MESNEWKEREGGGGGGELSTKIFSCIKKCT